MTETITHRGLEPGNRNFFTESSFEAFQDHLSRGFGVEFDVNFTKDNKIIIFHDMGLERVSKGKDKRMFSQMESRDIEEVKMGNGRICFLDELLEIIQKGESTFNALHLKSNFQEKKYVDILIKDFNQFKGSTKKILIFNVRPETAEYLKGKNKEIILAPSVAHEYDIERYGSCVGNSLISVNEAIKNRNLYDWVWLDEWDRSNRNGLEKTLYNAENFGKLREQKFKIAVVSPELHHTSPGLLGGESHQDAISMEALSKRIKEIIKLKPDAICTDYPDLVKNNNQ